MRKFKKLLFVGLALLIAFSSLAGCVGRPDEDDNGNGNGVVLPEKPDKLIIWEVGEQLASVRKLADKFTAKHGIFVEVVELGNLEQRDALKLDGPAGLGADVVTWPHDQIGEAVMAGIIQPISEWLEDGTLAGYYESALDALSFDGELYGLPKAVETTALVYNKDIIATPPSTWAELMSLTEEHTNKADNRFGFLFDFKNFYFVHGFFAGMGGYVFGFDGGYDVNDIGMNNAGAVGALELIKDLTDRGLLPLSTDYGVMEDQFNQGRTPMIINGPWSINGYKDAGINVGVAPLPTLPNGQHPNTFSGVKGWYISEYSANPYWAAKLIEFITSKVSLQSRFADTGELPPRHDVVIDDPIAAGFLAQAEFAQSMPNVPEMGPVWGNIGDAIDLATRGELTPQAALDQAVQFIRDAIAEMNE
jgi:arabinogalactan oligomer/maltooligosaccharide transport system substrate-binding protein